MKTVNNMNPNETFADNLYKEENYMKLYKKEENKMRYPQDIKIGEYTLKEILDRHLQYLQDFSKKDMCANLCDVDLRSVDLSYTDLSHADLRSVNLCNANLRDADLSYTRLYGARLCGADLRGTNLSGANLNFADLSDAKLNDVELYCTDLCGADLHDANLNYAKLCVADLSYADLSGADLSYADLCGANLYGAKLYGINERYLEFRKGKILTESIIGYKKCRGDVIVRLEIPRGAVVFSINGNKCRTNKAKVISIDGADRAYSNYHYMNMTKYMSYYVGDEITVYNFNCEYNVECAEGIHFFMTREEAEK